MEFDNPLDSEDLYLAQHLIESLRQDKEGLELLKRIKSSNAIDPDIYKELNSRLQSSFSTSVSGGRIKNIIQIAKADVINFDSGTSQETKLLEEKLHNIPPSSFEFSGRQFDIEILHQKLNQNFRVVIYSEQNNYIQTEIVKKYAKEAWGKKIYPGGICWIQADEIDVENQILGFFKSKISSQLPERRNLKSLVDYCWSNWQKGKVLIVVDNVINYHKIKCYLPLEQSKFKLIIIPEYNYGFEEENVEEDYYCLILEESNKILTETINITQNKYFFIFSIIIVVLFLLSGTSLYLSYVKSNSIAWEKNFTKYGWYIEWFRFVIFMQAEVAVLFIFFREEFLELIGKKKIVQQEFKGWYYASEIVILGFSLGVFLFLFYYHLNLAPENLAEWWNSEESPRIVMGLKKTSLDSDEGKILYKIPYLYYALYSFIQYIIIYLPVVCVSAYSAVKNLWYLNKTVDETIKKINSQLSSLNSVFFSKVDTCSNITGEFKQLSEVLEKKIKHYFSLYKIFSFGVAYEVIFGRYTLADIAIVLTVIAYLMWFSWFQVVLTWAYQDYQKAFNEIRKILYQIDVSLANNFEANNNIKSMKIELARNNSDFYKGRNIIIGTIFLGIAIEIVKIFI